MSSPTFKELIGATLILGFRGDTFRSDSLIAKAIVDYSLAGVILFDKDMVENKPVHNIKSPAQVRSLCNHLQQASNRKLLISIDQEGGRVNRLKPEYGFPETLSHMELGKIRDINQTYKQSVEIAITLKEIGINLNFAPVVDIDLNNENPIIHKKERSFSSDATSVTEHARAYIKGHNENGILTALKHFPGHGSSFGDTHLGFTDVSETWKIEELIPYNQLFSEGYDQVVMPTHIFNKYWDKNYPATLSHAVLTDMLRKKMNFNGLIISDDMQMGAITEKYGLEEAVILALNAGVNVMCFGNNLTSEPITAMKMEEIVEKAIAKGRLKTELLEQNHAFVTNFINSHIT